MLLKILSQQIIFPIPRFKSFQFRGFDVRQTDAVTYDVTADVKNKMVIFQIDPAQLDTANSFDVLGCTIDDSSEATNIANVIYVLEMKEKQTTPPSVITD